MNGNGKDRFWTDGEPNLSGCWNVFRKIGKDRFSILWYQEAAHTEGDIFQPQGERSRVLAVYASLGTGQYNFFSGVMT